MTIHSIQRLTFSSSAYFGSHIEFRLTGDRLTAGYSNGPMPPEKTTRRLDPEEKEILLKALAQCDVLSWKRKYYQFGVLDGESWSIAIAYDNGQRFRSEGYAEFPPGFDDLKMVLIGLAVKCQEQGGSFN